MTVHIDKTYFRFEINFNLALGILSFKAQDKTMRQNLSIKNIFFVRQNILRTNNFISNTIIFLG